MASSLLHLALTVSVESKELPLFQVRPRLLLPLLYRGTQTPQSRLLELVQLSFLKQDGRYELLLSFTTMMSLFNFLQLAILVTNILFQTQVEAHLIFQGAEEVVALILDFHSLEFGGVEFLGDPRELRVKPFLRGGRVQLQVHNKIIDIYLLWYTPNAMSLSQIQQATQQQQQPKTKSDNIHHLVGKCQAVTQLSLYHQMNPSLSVLVLVLVSLLALACRSESEVDQGGVRLATLRIRTLASPDSIINFSKKDYKQFVLQYPRPYTLVIYFSAKQVPLSEDLYGDYNYTVQLYKAQGAIEAEHNPTFFVRLHFSPETQPIFKSLGFDSAPNLLVSKPHTAVVSGPEREAYLKNFKWRISQTDGVVTTQKMLDFVNKRTDRSVEYKPTQETIQFVLLVFTGLSVFGVVVYKLLRGIWNHWVFWFLASMLIYFVCMSGIVYCVLNDSIQHDLRQTGKTTFFQSRGGRSQGFYEGLLLSGIISLTGVIFLLIALAGERLRERYSVVVGVVGIVAILYLISYLEGVYGVKSWYGPSYQPPQGYLKGPLNVDQGNNI